MRAALYGRVSTEDQAERYGLAAQLDAVRAEAARRGYHNAGEYLDDGYSGAFLDRPAMNRLREAARAKAFDVVLFPTLDRLARSIEVQAVLLSEFRRLGVRVEFVTMRTEDTKEHRALLNFMGTIAEYEREAIRDRTVQGRRKKAASGLVVSPRNAPYGYEADPDTPGKLRLCKPEADVVRLCYRLCVDEGKSLMQIVAELHRRRVPARRGQWGTTQVARILKDERYTGTVYYGRHNIRPDGTRRLGSAPIAIAIPPIVSPAQRDAARAQLRKNRAVLVGRPANFTYMLTGLLRCGACGARYDGVPSSGRRGYRHRRGVACRGPWFLAHKAETAVWQAIRDALRNPETFRQAALEYETSAGARDVELRSQEAHLRKQIDKIQAQERRLIRLVAADEEQGDLVQAELRQLATDRRRLAEQLQVTQDKVARHAGLNRLRDIEALCATAREGIDQLDEPGRVGLLRDLVDEVRVGRDRSLTIHGVLAAGNSCRPS